MKSETDEEDEEKMKPLSNERSNDEKCGEGHANGHDQSLFNRLSASRRKKKDEEEEEKRKSSLSSLRTRKRSRLRRHFKDK